MTVGSSSRGGAKRIVVTGGAGFIGANTCRRLLRSPEVGDVVVLDDLSTGSEDNLRDVAVDLLVGSVLEPQVLDEALRGADAVIHLAAVPSVPRSVLDPVHSHEVNATGTLLVLEAARRAGGVHVVVASSSSVYGADRTLPKHEGLRPLPVSPYAVSKLAAEAHAQSHQHVYGLPTLALRFFNVFGPLQSAGHPYAAVVPAFVSAALDGKPLLVHGDGTASRDFTVVDTVSAVLCDAVLRRVTSPTAVNLALGTRTTLLELIAVLEDVLGHALERRHVAPRPGDVQHSQADPTLLRALFPTVQPVPLRAGVQQTVDWFVAHGAARR